MWTNKKCGILFHLLLLFLMFIKSRENAIRGPKLILYVEGKTIAEVLLHEDGQIIHCSLEELEEDSDAAPIVKSRGLPVKYPSFKGMLKLIKDCSKHHMSSSNSSEIETDILQDERPTLPTPMPTSSIWRGIVPGTKWCGINDIAQNFDDLGLHYQVDACCRAHDHCPVKLKAFRTGYDLVNIGFYTKSHCECDSQFFGCLKECNSTVANSIGNIFFNVMRLQCLRNRKQLACLEHKNLTDETQECVKWGEEVEEDKMVSTTTLLKY